MATDTNKSGMAPKNPTKPATPATKNAADGFIMMAMAVVTLALCIGLVTQVGLSFWLAVTVSAAFYMGLLTLHALVRRHDQLDDMRGEIDRLTKEVARLHNTGPAARAATAPTPGEYSAPNMTAAMPPRAQAPAPSAAPGVAGPDGGLVGVATPPAQNQMPRHPAHAPAQPISAGPEPAGMVAPVATTAVAHAAKAPKAPVVRAPKSDMASSPMQADKTAPSASGAGKPDSLPNKTNVPASAKEARTGKAEQPPKRKGGAFREGFKRLRGKSADQQAKPDIAAPAARANSAPDDPNVPAEQHPRTARNASLNVPPPSTMAAAVPPASPNHLSKGPATGKPGASNEKKSNPPAVTPHGQAEARHREPQAQDGNSGGFAYRPGDAREASVSPSESDVEMIQNLIKKLADEVNSADARKLSADRETDALNTDAVDRSVGALRQAVRNMQEPSFSNTAASMADGDTPKSKPYFSKKNTTEQSAIPRSNTPLSSKPSSNTPATDVTGRTSHSSEPRAGSEGRAASDAFDVEALMRRAKPIATMTSMPPPLPAAPNVMAPTPAKDGATGSPVRGSGLEKSDPPASAKPESVKNAAQEAPPATDDFWDFHEDSFAAPQPEDSTQRRLARIASAIEAGRIDILLEPILDLEQQQACHYEVGVRLRDQDGLEIAPDDPEETGRPSGALPLLDSLRLKRTAQVARRLDERNKSGNVFSTFSGQSLTSDSFLSTFADTYGAQSRLANQLVLTFTQDDARQFTNPHWTMINEMRGLGFGFALRAVTDLDMDFEVLANAGFQYVKLDAEVFLSGLPAPGGSVPAVDLCKHFSQLGLTTVVEALDDQAKREKVFAYGVRFGQGAIFGGARVVKTSGNGQRSAAA